MSLCTPQSMQIHEQWGGCCICISSASVCSTFMGLTTSRLIYCPDAWRIVMPTCQTATTKVRVCPANQCSHPHTNFRCCDGKDHACHPYQAALNLFAFFLVNEIQQMMCSLMVSVMLHAVMGLWVCTQWCPWEWPSQPHCHDITPIWGGTRSPNSSSHLCATSVFILYIYTTPSQLHRGLHSQHYTTAVNELFILAILCKCLLDTEIWCTGYIVNMDVEVFPKVHSSIPQMVR